MIRNFDTDEATRQRMRNVRHESTSIELAVRRLLHRLGYRFTLRRKELVGNPDVILPKYHAVVFVHGCFWHGHEHCSKGTRRPKRNAEFWKSKIIYNQEKDARVESTLREQGWRVVIVWECEISDVASLGERLTKELSTG